MKKDKILKSSENIPPIWSVNETWGAAINLTKTTNNNFFCIMPKILKNKIEWSLELQLCYSYNNFS
jgi:hypothetical protein